MTGTECAQLGRGKKEFRNVPRPEIDSMTVPIYRLIEEAGKATQSLGFGRVLGQLYMVLYFSPKPCTLADMQHALSISKGSASTMVRQLEQWGAVRKVWVKGDRKDYYEAEIWFGRILKQASVDTVGKKLSAYRDLLNEVEGDMKRLKNGEGDFVRGQIVKLRKFHDLLADLWNNPLVQGMLK